MPDEPIKKGPPPTEEELQKLREAELQRAATFSKKRQEHETEVKEHVKQQREKDALLGRAAQDRVDLKKVAFTEKKKEYGVMTKKREKEIAEMKKRRDAEQKLFEQQKTAKDAKRKKNEGYMQDLNEMGRLKILEQHRVDTLKAELVRSQQKAEYEYRAAVDAAQREELQARDLVERDSRQRRSLTEADARAKLYQLEASHRSKITSHDTELRSQVSALLLRSPLEAQRSKSQIEIQFRTKKRRLETEHQEKKHEIDLALTRAKLEIDNDMRATLAQAELSHRHAIQTAERKRAQVLEEQNQLFEKKLYDRRPDSK